MVLGTHADTKKSSVIGEMFNYIKEASSFWKSLWEGNRTGNKNAAWLDELRAVINKQVPTPIEEAWKLDTSCSVKGFWMEEKLGCNWKNRLVNFWWKRAHTLYESLASSFQAVCLVLLREDI